jgi:hypothetical protein
MTNNVKDYGAKADGKTDDASSIQAAIDALPPSGGEVHLPEGTYVVGKTIKLGGKTGIHFSGSGSGSSWWGMLSNSGASVLKWTGPADKTLLEVSGRTEGTIIDNLVLDGNSRAGTLLHVLSGMNTRVNNVLGYKWGGDNFGIIVNNAMGGQGWCSQTWTNVILRDPPPGGNGIQIAPSHSVCECSFISCEFSHGKNDGTVGIQLGYADHNSFIRCATFWDDGNRGFKTGGIAIEVKPVPGYPEYPYNNMFFGCGLAGGIKLTGNWAYFKPALLFYPLVTGDKQAVPPRDYRNSDDFLLPYNLCGGETDEGEGLGTTMGWLEPVLENGWTNFGGEYANASYFMDKNRIVHLKGLVRYGRMGQTIFKLPPRYRPKQASIFNVVSNDGNNVPGRVDVYWGSVIAIYGGSSWLSLDGISFKADN